MPYNLLLLPLLGGYIFVRRCYLTRYTALRSENYRLILLSAEFGVYFLVVAAVVRYFFNLLAQAVPFIAYLNDIRHAILPFDYSGTALLAFVLGLVMWRPVNYLYDKNGEVDKAIAKKGDPLEVLLKKAMDGSRPVLLTMQSGKVYVGQVNINFNPAYEVQSIKISPILSGYRDVNDQTVHFNIDYTHIYGMIRDGHPDVANLDTEEIGTVIPLSEIRSVSIFNLHLYKKHFHSNTTAPLISD
jgi:hypothetical protein